MSHFTKCNMKITNLVALRRALEDLKYNFKQAEQGQNVEVRGWRGQKLAAEISIDMGKYDIGVVKNENGTYDLVADWWGVETTQGITEQEFSEELNQRYAYQRVVEACEQQGYQMEEQKDEETGEIKLVATKWE
jgi:hypothetical protein